MKQFHFYDKDDPRVPDFGYHHYVVTAPTAAVAYAAMRKRVQPEVMRRLRKSKTAFDASEWGPGAVVTRLSAGRPSPKAKHSTGRVKRPAAKRAAPRARRAPAAKPKKRAKKKSAIGQLAGRLEQKFYRVLGVRKR